MRTILLFGLLLLGVSSHAENYPYRADCLWLTVPDHADWLYTAGEEARVEVSLYRYGIPQDVEVSYEIGPDMMPVTASGKVMLTGGRTVINMGTMNTPGFLDLRLTATLDGNQYRHHVKVGFSPELLTPYTANPADFDTFWQEAIGKARNEVKNERLLVSSKRVDEYCTDATDMYLLKLHTDRFHSIYAYLSMPKPQTTGLPDSRTDGPANGQREKYPVVLCPPGAGVKTIKEPMRSLYYAKNGFIRLEIDIHGLNPYCWYQVL